MLQDFVIDWLWTELVSPWSEPLSHCATSPSLFDLRMLFWALLCIGVLHIGGHDVSYVETQREETALVHGTCGTCTALDFGLFQLDILHILSKFLAVTIHGI